MSSFSTLFIKLSILNIIINSFYIVLSYFKLINCNNNKQNFSSNLLSL